MKRTYITGSRVAAVVALSLTILFGGSTAFGFPIAPPPNYTSLFFNSVEVFIDKDQSDNVTVGDVFFGIFQVQSIKNSNDPSGHTGPTIWFIGQEPKEITGYFALEVADILPEGTIPAYPGLPVIVLKDPSGDPNGILGPGESLRIYEDNVVDYDDSSVALGLATATNGTLWGSLGGASLGPGNLGYWYTVAPTAPPAQGDVGVSYAGLNMVLSPPGLTFNNVNDPNENYSSGAGDPDGLWVSVFFNSEIFALSSNTQFGPGDDKWDFGSNDPAVMKPVPEPATMMLLGSGLVGLAGFARRRKKLG